MFQTITWISVTINILDEITPTKGRTFLNKLSDHEVIKETDKNFNVLTHYFKNIDWNHLASEFLSKAILLLVTSVLLIIVHKVGLSFIRSSFRKSKKEFSENRINTLYTITKNVFEYTLFFIFIYSLLTIIGIPVGSLLAGAGIAGIAIGLGAQGFINDIITGFFIILERQLEVGDIVQINDVKGTVVAVGIRTTQIKSADGTLNFIPNRTILLISNSSRNDMLVQIDIRINPSENLELIRKVIKEVNQKLVPEYTQSIKNGPNILGLTDIGNGNFAFRVTMYVQNGMQASIQRDFLQAYLTELKQNQINVLPNPLIIPTNK